MAGKKLFEFGPFRLAPNQRELTRAGEPISLTPKAFDVLVFLLERRGQLVSKADMMSEVWPDTAVEEGNLAWNVSAVRKALADEAGTNYIETVPKFGYRFVAEVQEIGAESTPVDDALPPASAIPVAAAESAMRRRARVGLYVAALAVLALATGALTYPWSRTAPLAERDWILIAGIENRTGEPDLDDVLSDTVAVQFDQSPYFRVFSRDRIDEQLKLMRREAGERLTDPIARDICERAGIKAFVTGTVTRVGPDYIINLIAVDARDGDALGRNLQTVSDIPGALRAVINASVAIRRDLGESLRSIQTFSVPAEIATTSSLPALRAFREGQRLLTTDQSPKAVPFFHRAVELDPDFAAAYVRLSAVYANLTDRRKAEWAAREAFVRRDRVSERERHEIDSKYYRDVTGEHSKAVEAMELGARLFPDDARAQNLLQIELRDIGRLKEAVTYGELAVRLNPKSSTYRSNLLGSYLRVGNLEAARTLRNDTERDGLDTPAVHRYFRLLAAVSDDSAAIAREEEWQKKFRTDSNQLSDFAASQLGVAGQLAAAQAQYRDLLRRTDARGRTALATAYLSRLVMLETLLDPDAAVKSAQELLARDPSRYEAAESAFVFAIVKGDLTHIRELASQYPQDELLNGLWLPMSQAVIEIRAGRPAQAVPLLRALENYDLGDFAALRPSYFLGRAHLALGAAADARLAFERLIRNRGVASANPLFALGQLGLARAAAMAGSPTDARAAYERFFAVWKDADSKSSIMKAARTEYAQLK